MNKQNVLTCKEFIDFLDDYVTGDLSVERTAIFERHLATCSACVSYLDSYQQTIFLVKQMNTEDVVPDDVPDDLVSAILAATPFPK